MYKKILVPLDGSILAECVLPHVDSIARGCAAESVTFIRVVELPYLPVTVDSGYSLTTGDLRKLEDEFKDAAEKYLSRIVNGVKYDGVKVQSKVVSGKPAESIADYAAKNKVDLIIIATHGRSGASRWVWGSVADKLLRSVQVPVLMVRAPGAKVDI